MAGIKKIPIVPSKFTTLIEIPISASSESIIMLVAAIADEPQIPLPAPIRILNLGEKLSSFPK